MSYLKSKNIHITLYRTLATFMAGFFFLAISGCAGKDVAVTPYFQFDSLMTEQVRFLLARRATVEKTATLREASSTETFAPDSLGWRRELDVFTVLDIMNKPVYRGRYKTDVREEAGSVTKSFIAAEAALPVQQVILTYDKASTLQKLEATFAEAAPLLAGTRYSLYKGARYMKLEFENLGGNTVVSSYSINGGQKTLLADSVSYEVNTRVLYPQ